MKDKIRSLLGIEMSLGEWQFKPFILFLGILFFGIMIVFLIFVYSYLFIKNTLYNSWNEIKKSNKLNKYKGVKRV